MTDVAYTLVYDPNPTGKYSVSEFRTLLQKPKDESKIDAMKQILITMLDGHQMPELLMDVIRFVMPSRNKQLKKLLYFYWEIVSKLDSDGKLKQEMILVCNAIQKDLQHPNEYIRGNTLRFLTKLHEPELLEQLVPSARACLEHRHAYVRKYAIFAIYSIYKVSDHLIPDAPEIISDVLVVETDPTCKRNAFTSLGDLDRNAALRFIQENISALETIDPLLQLAFIEFIRKDKSTELKTRYINLLSELLESSTSNTVIYEAANTLILLTNNPAFVSLAANKFIELTIKISDNNVKLIALERIRDIHKHNPGVLDELVLDILKILSSPDLDIKKKAIEISLELISSRNVDEVLKLFKKELTKTINSDADKTVEYRQLLISAIHQTAINFAQVAASVVDLLLDFLPELSTNSATEILSFIKEVVEKFPDLRSSIIQRLLNSLDNIRSGKIFRGALWIIGEYSLEFKDIQNAWKHIRSSVGEIPIIQSERKHHGHDDENGKAEDESAHQSNGSKPVVLPDGTYATESALDSKKEKKQDITRPPLRQFIIDGEFYTAAVLASTFVKLILRLDEVSNDDKILNAIKAEGLLILVSILRVAKTSYVKKQIDEDSEERILTAISYIAEGKQSKLLEIAFLESTKEAFKEQVKLEDDKRAQKNADELQKNLQQVDELISFRQFGKINEETDTVEEDLTAVTGIKVEEDLSSRLKKIVQLTGFSDPVYAEAYVKVQQFDVILDVLLVNQTTETLKNLHVEFATLGDLKVLDKPASQNVPAHGFFKIQTTIKVTSADTGVIFGNIIYDGSHGAESKIVILNDVHVDIMDYIKPSKCSESKFRTMWNEFEWENKIVIKSTLPSLKEYFDELLKGTNMACLTPGAIIGEECQFLSANLYSKSSFGEDALANLCIEKQTDGPVIGHVRIRSKGQGLALSLGDRVAAIARKTNKVQITHV
jgi:coatomer subunit beta